MNFQPTDEQQAIFDAVEGTTENLTLVARAGAAKTTTLTGTRKGELAGVVQRLPQKKRVLCLAFNKAIAEEMVKRIPANAEARTLNSLGFRALGRFLPKWPALRENKLYTIMRDMDYHGDSEAFGEILQACKLAKAIGYINHPMCRSLVDEHELFEALPLEYEAADKQFILKVLDESTRWVFEENVVDFADQLLISTLHKSIAFDRYDVVLVDEAQDLSALNHAMVKKLVKGKTRLIVAGDPLQAIYGFRGAHEQSMEELSTMFNCTELKLCTTFRCAKSIVEHVQWLAPDMVAWEGASQGQIEDIGDDWELNDVPEGSAILCRRNAPLMYLSLEFFLAGINAEYVGHDTLFAIERVLKGLKNPRARQPEVKRFINDWIERNKRKYKDSNYYDDMGQCLHLLADRFQTLREVNSFIRSQKHATGRIKLMTVHKAKGLEFDTSFVLNQELFGEGGQELNIQYVAKTRSRENLFYIEG